MVRVRLSEPSLAGVLRPRKFSKCEYERLSLSREALGACDIEGDPPGEERAVSNDDATDKRLEFPCPCLNAS
jgi:hypothetical protein